MPTAFGHEDAEFAFIVSSFARQSRNTLTFQISPRLSAAFRYSLLYDVRPEPTSPVAEFRFDRSFSFQYRLIDEGRFRPAVAVGINDLLGTGIYAGEYVVFSKALRPDLRATLGVGWGRLGSFGSFENPLSVLGDGFKDRPGRTDIGLGGQFQYQSWFHGDAAFFGGVEWQASDQLRFVVEYSSDDYAREDGAAFEHRSPLNFGVSYQYNDRTTLTANYLYGSEFGVQLTYVINPKKPRYGSGMDTAPLPILPASGAGDWLDFTQVDSSASLSKALAQEGVALDGLEISGATLRVQVRNDRYSIASQAVGRTARVLARLAPPGVETFDIRLSVEGMPVTSVIIRRKDLEELEFHPVAPDLLRSRTRVLDTPESLQSVDERYPILSYGLDPYLIPSLFDPDSPVRLDIGVALKGRYEPLPGLVFSGVVQQKLAGNLDDITRVSDSVLPHVRSDASLYFKGGSTAISELTAAYYFRPGRNLFGRVTAGYLEGMFGGVSAEILWKPQNSRLALGAEMNYVKQRDFDRLFGFQDYEVATGHLSAYYDLGGGYLGQLDVGRYLAGDVGATLTLAREFDNGWRIGAYATVTDVSAADFGEGSFDKGILLTIPVDWVTGRPSKTKFSTVIRPVQRDGGARLGVSGRLYDMIRENQATGLDASWGRFWR
ncbi:MAG: YjbH domain-containing protein [Rhodobacteraceae bacterium]|nr:YjbH domain-containing protein [Paracoccaceae bacterium]